MLLDSTFLHDLLRDDPAAVDRLKQSIHANELVALSTLTVFEVGVGLRGAAEQHRIQFRETVEKLEQVPIGTEQAWAALDIQRDLHDRGEPIGAVDVLIAGSAATREDSRVLTRNVGEFSRVDAIAVETY